MLRAVALLLTLLTGFSGLVYEVTWQKYLATLLGSHSEATAAVLGIFLGGLSVGYALFGAVTRRIAHRGRGRVLFVYGLVEAGIGVYALLFPLLFRGTAALSIALPQAGGGLGFAVDVVLTALLIGPATVLMGGTIPLLTQALSTSLRDATRLHALVYASNTVGAFAGALAAAFLLIPRLGLDAVMLWMGVVNLVAGGIFLALGTRAPAPAAKGGAARAAAAPGAPQVAGFALLAGVALLSGFAMMAIQTTLNRIAALSIGASQFTFSIVVATFVLCIALGSLAVSALRRIPQGASVVTQWLLVALLLLLYLQVSNAPYWAHLVRTWFDREPAQFLSYQLTLGAMLLLVLAVPIGLSGALLPLLFHALRREVGDLGSAAGRLYSANTVGSLLGSLVGGYLLLYWLDLHHVARIAVLALAVGAFLLSLRLLATRWVVASGVALAVTTAILFALPPWSQANLTSSSFRERAAVAETAQGPEAFFEWRSQMGTLLFYDDDPTLTASVRALMNGSTGLFTNGKPDTSVPIELTTVLLLGALPCLFAEQCKSAFVVGLGTGVTAGVLGQLDGMERVVVAEISPAVRDALPYFADFNAGVGEDPRVEIRHGDAYRALLRDQSRYDAIVSEPSNPWVSGVENLYSREFLQSAKQRLSPGGVYAQWFHTYESSDQSLELVLRTYASVFADVAVWRGMGPDLIILGFDRAEHALDVARLETRMRLPGYAGQLARIERNEPLALLSQELLPLGVAHAAVAGEGETISLLHPVLSHRASIDFFVGAGASLPDTAKLERALVAARNSLVRRYVALHGGSLDEEGRLDLVMPSCTLSRSACATLMGNWAAEVPDSELLQQTAHHLIDGGLVLESEIDQLEQFFHPDYRAVSSPLAVSEAATLVQVFIDTHLPSVPFRRSSLRAMLARCVDGVGGAQCSELRRRTETLLGDLSVEAVGFEDPPGAAPFASAGP